MSLEENKEIVRRLDDEVYNKGNFAIADVLVSPDYINYRNTANELRGPVLVKRGATLLRAVFPDLYLTSMELVAEGDRVVHRFTLQGTQQKAFLGLAPAGRRFITEGIAINRVVDGQIIESWASISVDDILRQLQANDTGATTRPQPAAIPHTHLDLASQPLIASLAITLRDGTPHVPPCGSAMTTPFSPLFRSQTPRNTARSRSAPMPQSLFLTHTIPIVTSWFVAPSLP